MEGKGDPDSCNTVKKKQTLLKEAVSPLVKKEGKDEKDQEGMKLRRRSKIKVTDFFF